MLSTLRGWPYIHIHMNSTNLTHSINNTEDINLGGGCDARMSER